MPSIKSGIKINGQDADFTVENIPLELLELDPTNPRIGYYQDTLQQRGEEITPDKILFAIKTGDYDGYNSLMENIESNNGIMVEIWVYPIDGGKYCIADGNTRYSIYKDLSKKYPNNPTWKKIPAKILSSDFDQRAVDFIRLTTHLQGINNWQTYERARYIYQLYDNGYDIEELARRTKLTRPNITRWLKAYKDMEEEFLPKYADALSNPLSKFSYFDEYNKGNITELMAKNELKIDDFCSWVGNEEIMKAADVRELPDMLKDHDIARTLREEGFSAAYTQLITRNPAKGSKLFDENESVINGIKNMSFEEIISIQNDPDSAKRELLKTLYEKVGSLLDKVSED